MRSAFEIGAVVFLFEFALSKIFASGQMAFERGRERAGKSPCRRQQGSRFLGRRMASRETQDFYRAAEPVKAGPAGDFARHGCLAGVELTKRHAYVAGSGLAMMNNACKSDHDNAWCAPSPASGTT